MIEVFRIRKFYTKLGKFKFSIFNENYIFLKTIKLYLSKNTTLNFNIKIYFALL